MTDSMLLKKAIHDSGYRLGHIAKCLGLSYQALSNKINNVTEFKASEIGLLSNLLSLENCERKSIFLARMLN